MKHVEAMTMSSNFFFFFFKQKTAYEIVYGRIELGLGQTHYIGVSGAFGEAPSAKDRIGIFVNRKKHSLRRVTDGTSKTLMFGENNGGWASDGRYAGIMWIGVEIGRAHV